MRVLRLMALIVLGLTAVGCVDTPAGKAVDADHAEPYYERGGPRDGYAWMVNADVLAKWVREIPQITLGTEAEEVVKRLGKPDQDYVAGGVTIWFSDKGYDRCLTYFVAMDRNEASELVGDECITLYFDQDNRYKSYEVDNPLHRKGNEVPATPDQGVARLMPARPEPSTDPATSQTSD